MMKETNRLHKEFDESAYLKSNSDVFDAVQKGDFSSGEEHYMKCGAYENRPGVPEELEKMINQALENDVKLPLPPEDLRVRVHGDKDISEFNQTGKMVSLEIAMAVQLASIQLGDDSRILDFGCGCGRVVRWLHTLHENSSFYGTDIDSQAISWCQEHLSYIGEFSSNNEWPPLPFPDEFFDFIYSISIFTHLPEDMQFSWLEELQRVTKKGSYLLLTVHGEEIFQTASEKEKNSFKKNGFYYLVGEGTNGLSEFYQTSFHMEEYIRKQWSRFFEITKIIKRGIRNNQDLIICKRIQ
ncbi:MAG: class I SAM-dependent methyltransferase [Gammaproteobacteria bacterium]|nr:class I SAM-dependent methyltransferase [Gammaproteobacteria bacterium]